MGGAPSVALPEQVAPGQILDVSVDLVAPAANGEYQGFWKLQEPNGSVFGVGPAATGNLWVLIRVTGEPIPTASASPPAPGTGTTRPTSGAEATGTAPVSTQSAAVPDAPKPGGSPTPAGATDLASLACTAQWQSNEGILGCPGPDGDPRGAVALLDQAQLEDGITTSAPTLLTVPSASQEGYVLGLYPPYRVQTGDRLQAGVGCEAGAQLCSVLFRISYLDEAGAAHDLWTLGEFYDARHVDLDLDLTALAGQQIRLVLSVSSLGSATDDRALWVAPRILRLPPPVAAPGVVASPAATTPTSESKTAMPSPSTAPGSATPVLPSEGPAAPIPQMIDSLLEFLRRLLNGPQQ